METSSDGYREEMGGVTTEGEEMGDMEREGGKDGGKCSRVVLCLGK